jgi:hypothetical protein
MGTIYRVICVQYIRYYYAFCKLHILMYILYTYYCIYCTHITVYIVHILLYILYTYYCIYCTHITVDIVHILLYILYTYYCRYCTHIWMIFCPLTMSFPYISNRTKPFSMVSFFTVTFGQTCDCTTTAGIKIVLS